MQVVVKTERTRSSSGAIQKLGLATGLSALGLLAVLAMVVGSLPELRRYVKMESM